MDIRSPFDNPDVIVSLTTALPGFLRSQRWFGDKARPIESVKVVATFSIDRLPAPATLAVLEVAFLEGGSARYVLPVTVAEGADRSERDVCFAYVSGQLVVVRDALLEPGFRKWVLELLIDGRPVQAGAGRLEVDRQSSVVSRLESLVDESSRVLGAEQSNSSLVFGNDVFIKLFRRLQAGINPDVELNRFLTYKGGFRNVPTFLGSISYVAPAGESTVVAVAQSYVESLGDSWQFVLDLVTRRLLSSQVESLLQESPEVARRLGEITAGMHLALGSDPWTPELAPESISAEDTSRWQEEYLATLDTAVASLRRADASRGERARELAEAFLDVAAGLRTRASGFDRLVGRTKSRVHGDYHLGQVLRTRDGDFVVIDFEGEPQRPMSDRRRKTSPLKDVAGMLRSFAYARGTIESNPEIASGLHASDLVAWERTMRRSFLDAYIETAGAGGAKFLPVSTEDIHSAIVAWELDKAAYELLYELNNRPDWLWIPLSGMLKYGEPQS